MGGIYFPGTLGHDAYVGGRWIKAPNAFVIIKSGAGRPVKREGGGSAWERAHQQHEGLLLMTHLIIQEVWVPCVLFVLKKQKNKHTHPLLLLYTSQRARQNCVGSFIQCGGAVMESREPRELFCFECGAETKAACERSRIVNLFRAFICGLGLERGSCTR